MRKNRIYRQIAADCTKAYWSSILFYTLQLIVSQIAVAYSAKMLGVFSNYILNRQIEAGLGCLWQILICVAISVTLPLACSTLGEMLMFRASLNHERTVLNRYLHKTYAAAAGLRGSDAQFRLEEDQIQLGVCWNGIGMYLIAVPVVVIYLLWQMVPVLGWFTLFVAAVCGVRILVPVFFRKKTEEYDRLERESRTKMRNVEQEMLEKPVELCLYGLQNDELTRFQGLQKDYLETLFSKKAKLETWQKNILGGMDSFCMLVLLAAAAIAISSGKMGVESVTAMIGFYYVFQTAVGYVLEIVKQLPICKNLVKRISVFYEDQEKTDGETVGEVSAIAFRNVTFSYDGKNDILKNCSEQISMHKKNVICGENGTGKSTLLKLLLGLYPDYQGEILINGKELGSLNPVKWREKCAFVEQVPFLFEGTVRENVKLGRDVSDEEVTQMMERVGIAHLAERRVGGEKTELSGGECQKIAIARALLRNAEILILDEPTNHLDEAAKQWLMDFIQKFDQTMIYVSHEESMIQLADRKIAVQR